MKKLLAIALASMMILSVCSVLTFADDSKSFSVDYVNAYFITDEEGKKTAGDAIYLFTPAADGKTIEEVTKQKMEWWNVYVFEFNTTKSVYEVSEFHSAGTNLFKGDVEIPENGIIIASHGAGNARIDEELKTVGTHIVIEGIDIDTVEVHDTYGSVGENTITIGGEIPTTDPDPDPDPEPEKVMETIVLDGVFNDTGWASNGWKKVDSSNGKWQSALAEDETRDETFDFQIRTDDDNIYFGFKVNVAPIAKDDKFGNGNGSNLRIWFHNENTEYKAYNYFIDFSYKTDGSIGKLAKKNTNPDGNTGEDLSEADLAKILAKSTKGNNYWYVEGVVPKAAVGASDDDSINLFITYSAPLSYDEEDDDKPVKNNALTFGAYDGTEENRNAFAPYNDWDEDAQISLVFSNSALKEIAGTDPDPDPDPETPPTGQASIVYIAIAIIAVLGTATIVVRKRRI